MIITVCRKPFIGSTTNNVLFTNCGVLNIDGCRITFETDGKRKETKRTPREDRGIWSDDSIGYKVLSVYADADPRGRFPANVVLQHTNTCTILDLQSGVIVASRYFKVIK